MRNNLEIERERSDMRWLSNFCEKSEEFPSGYIKRDTDLPAIGIRRKFLALHSSTFTFKYVISTVNFHFLHIACGEVSHSEATRRRLHITVKSLTLNLAAIKSTDSCSGSRTSCEILRCPWWSRSSIILGMRYETSRAASLQNRVDNFDGLLMFDRTAQLSKA